MNVQINNNHFILHPSGAVYWEEKQTLLLADVHLGKVAHFRKNGIAVPRKAEGSFYQKMEVIGSRFSIERILFLGDLFHSFQNNEWYLFETWVKQQTFEMVLITGNHDVIPARKFEALGLTVEKQREEATFFFCHFPNPKTERFVFCGHLHPGVRLTGVGKQQLKLPCFYQSFDQLILPAFGAFTGLHLVKPKVEERIYVTTGKEVMEVKKTS
jgi:DNA ligase-associated metallophosphoesterase